MAYKPVPDVLYRPSEALREAAALGDMPEKVRGAVEALALDPNIANVRMSLRSTGPTHRATKRGLFARIIHAIIDFVWPF